MLRNALSVLILNIPCMVFGGLSYLFAKSDMYGFAGAMVLLALLSLHTLSEKEK